MHPSLRPYSSNIFIFVVGTLIYLVTIQYYDTEIMQLNSTLAKEARKVESLQDDVDNLRSQLNRSLPKESPQTIDANASHTYSLKRSKSSLCLLTAIHDKDLAEITLPFFLEYANHWGYPFYFYHSNKYVSRMENFKFKLRLIERYFEYCEWIAWLDSDMVLTNFSIALESFIDTSYEFLAAGPSPSGTWDLNAGVMFIHSSQWTRQLFAQVYALTSLDDQAALQQLLQDTDTADKAKMIAWKQLQQPYMPNRVGQWQRGDFSIHFWGPEKSHVTRFMHEQRDVLNNESYPFEAFVLGKTRQYVQWTDQL